MLSLSLSLSLRSLFGRMRFLVRGDSFRRRASGFRRRTQESTHVRIVPVLGSQLGGVVTCSRYKARTATVD